MYSEALLVTSQIAIMGENEPEVRRQLMPAINERMLKVMTELHVSREFKTADLLAAYLLQQFSRGAISSAHARIKFEQAASGAEPEGPGLAQGEVERKGSRQPSLSSSSWDQASSSAASVSGGANAVSSLPAATVGG